ncbi:hypothetical protein ASF66_13745 [Pseudomonas sp. Leaf129]|uniref:fimbrial biogenesis chaperone n=1 Tax=Pseudomonas sp. Leaf129 TaxID=1736268 RepID=UPI000702799F|nr:molecular chaperone [Pseudomonas sp. Leaf129]KQQ60796.1 hypothetical protein ASF66_13745 [Pseudomonas sp. Leaf129]
MRIIRNLLVTLWVFTLTAPALAGIEVGGTRLVFEAQKGMASLSIKNPDKNTPYLIQSWLDNGDEKVIGKIPFLVTPPLFLLSAGQENQVRVINTALVPTDRESLYWLNIKSIAPGSSGSNQLQISVRTRIKMIYRPVAIKKTAADAYKQLTVARSGNRLTFTNPTAHYVSFFDVKVGGTAVDEPSMVAPFATYSMNVSSSQVGKVSWRAINDYGGRTEEVTR